MRNLLKELAGECETYNREIETTVPEYSNSVVKDGWVFCRTCGEIVRVT